MSVFQKLSFLSILFLTLLAQQSTFGQTNISDKKSDKKLSQKQQDKLYLKQPGSESAQKFKKNFKASWNKTFVNFTDNSTYLLAGMSFSNQAITAAGFNQGLTTTFQIIARVVISQGILLDLG